MCAKFQIRSSYGLEGVMITRKPNSDLMEGQILSTVHVQACAFDKWLKNVSISFN